MPSEREDCGEEEGEEEEGEVGDGPQMTSGNSRFRSKQSLNHLLIPGSSSLPSPAGMCRRVE